jgi:hypothetical protein
VPTPDVNYNIFAPRTFGAAPVVRAAALLFLLLGCSDDSVVAVSSSAPESDDVQEITLANGLKAVVYSPDYLRDRLTTFDGEPAIQLDDARYLPVVTDIDDPSIVNKGDGRFHPFTVDLVTATMNEVEHPTMPFRVNVYLLPYPRRMVLVSSTVGVDLFLSPHVLDIDPAVAAYIIAHELGHAFHNQFMPSGSPGWDDYRRMRGIEDETKFHDLASHAYRPREIFAEDFRVLFGGPRARALGGIENPELASPERVFGLDRFFARVTTVDQPPSLRIGSLVPRHHDQRVVGIRGVLIEQTTRDIVGLPGGNRAGVRIPAYAVRRENECVAGKDGQRGRSYVRDAISDDAAA